jgi:hypothetical protein
VVNALNYGSLAVNGLGLINTLVALHEKYHSKDLTPLEVFQFASSVLFFTMSAMNTKTASTVIKETQSGIIKDFEGSLRSNRHRRMFRRVAKQTHGKDGNTMQGNAKVRIVSVIERHASLTILNPWKELSHIGHTFCDYNFVGHNKIMR